MENEKTLFYVKSDIQKMLMLNEIQGQISDGLWEGRKPDDHWQFWCSFTKDTVVVDNEKIGRTSDYINGEQVRRKYGYVICRKDKYNLLNKEFVDVVGYRMIFMSKLFKVNKDIFLKLDYMVPESLEQYKNFKKYAADLSNESEKNGYAKIIKKWDEVGYTEEYLEGIDKDETLFSMKDLRKELHGLRKAIMSKAS